jgi:hypothetical protein
MRMSFLLVTIMEFLTMIQMNVIWEDDHLTIDLFEPIEHYVEQPSARLFEGEQERIDPDVYYERGVDRTFLSVVQTSHVHTYYIKYRVHFPTYGIVDTHTIVFDVVDRIAPVFHTIPTVRMPLDHALPDLTSGLIYDDNYDDPEDLVLTIETAAIVRSRVGFYPVTYRARDRSGNETVVEKTIEVYDHLAPTITVDRPLELPFGTPFRHEDYLTIKDNYDVVLAIEVDDSAVDYTTLGSYPIVVAVTDQSGLNTTQDLIMHVVDLEPPDIRLIGYRPTITVFEQPKREDLLEYVISVRDNYDGMIDPNGLLVETDLDVAMTGRYDIHYEISDSSDNVSTMSLEVDVVDDVKPEIIIKNSLSFPVDDPKPFLSEWVIVTDNYSDKDALDLDFEGTFKMDVIGRYPLTITLEDEAKNVARMMTYLEIYDAIEPSIEQIQDVVVTDFTRKKLDSYFLLSDNYSALEDIVFVVDDSAVEYERVGLYDLNVCAYDQSANHSCLNTFVLVVDVVDPVLSLTRDKVFFPVGERAFDPLEYVASVSDNHDMLTLSDVSWQGTIDFHEVGRYPITFEVADSSDNRTQIILEVYVDLFDVPRIDIEPVRSIEQYDVFDPDELVGTLPSGYTLDYFPSRIDTSMPGIKTMTYVITDERGNSSLYTQDIRVIERKKGLAPEAFIPVIVTNTLGAALFFYVRRKTRSF